MLIIWLGTFAAELALFGVRPLWAFRRPLAAMSILYIFASALLLKGELDFWPWALIMFITLFRMFNLARIIKNRMHAAYLRRVTRRTSFMLFIFQALSLLVVLPFLYIPDKFYFYFGI